MQNMMCASSIVRKPLRTASTLKNISRLIAVTISGFITGRSLMRSTITERMRLDLLRPIAAIVPTTVETTVAITAMAIV